MRTYPELRLVILNAEQDGVEQIATVLAEKSNDGILFNAIHIVSEGDAGELSLGNDRLTLDSITGNHADELAVIRSALADNADILIYGCNFAEGAIGLAATNALAAATDADVKASDDVTGVDALGGDWDLEVESGVIEATPLLASSYKFTLGPSDFDFGDAPTSYGTTLADDGARHNDTGPTLGANRDFELDGNPTPNADGDDLANTDDEDGVTFGTIGVGLSNQTVTVTVQNAPTGAKLDAWIDFNQDGNFNSFLDQIFDSVDVVNGVNNLTFDVPSTALFGTQTYARFRLSTIGDLNSTGAASDGEVEDYTVTLIDPDSDGDGITNSIDIDDDNDGILDADEGLILGGDFQTFTPDQTSLKWWSGFTNSKFLIDFSSGVAVLDTVTTIGQTGSSEGTASYTNPRTGELLLYTDGNSLFDGQTGALITTGIGGSFSSNEAALIIPLPNSDITNDFYVFGNSTNFTSGNTINVATVDIAAGSASTPSPIGGGATYSEALGFVPHANGRDYWLVSTTHRLTGDEQLHAYLVDENGIAATPVVTALPGIVNSYRSKVDFDLDSNQIIMGHNWTSGGAIQLADFDRNTGLASNIITHATGATLGYSVALLPDATKLYYSDGNEGYSGKVMQKDLTTGIVTDLGGSSFGGYAEGPDGKLYVANINSNSLGVIENPNAAGVAANFNPTGFNLGAAISGFSLPNQIYAQFFIDAFDTDLDGIDDYLDLDSDNDGITDNVEAQRTENYIAPSGKESGIIDVNGDGLDDSYDNTQAAVGSNASGSYTHNRVGLEPVDSDGDGIADFLDSDSDNDLTPDVAERGTGTQVTVPNAPFNDNDRDGLLDEFEGSDINDGFDVNDENLAGTNFNLADTDNDTVSDGRNAVPLFQDLDYRDQFLGPVFTFGITTSTPNVFEGDTINFDINLNQVLGAGNSASVSLLPISGDADNIDDYNDFTTALTDAANATAGVSFASNIITFDGNTFTGNRFSFGIDTIVDGISDPNETVVAALDNTSVFWSTGPAFVDPSQTLATATITEAQPQLQSTVVDFSYYVQDDFRPLVFSEFQSSISWDYAYQAQIIRPGLSLQLPDVVGWQNGEYVVLGHSSLMLFDRELSPDQFTFKIESTLLDKDTALGDSDIRSIIDSIEKTVDDNNALQASEHVQHLRDILQEEDDHDEKAITNEGRKISFSKQLQRLKP